MTSASVEKRRAGIEQIMETYQDWEKAVESMQECREAVLHAVSLYGDWATRVGKKLGKHPETVRSVMRGVYTPKNLALYVAACIEVLIECKEDTVSRFDRLKKAVNNLNINL